MNNWSDCKWGDIAILEYGKALRGYEKGDGQYPVYGTNGCIGKHSTPLCNHPGVIIGRKGAYRGIHYSKKPFFVIDTAFYLKPKIEIDLKWAYYELLTHDINGMDSGSAIPSTSRDAFYNLPVKLPPLSEQRAIAHILGTLDDKIEANCRMNETLEAIARAIFKSWFVDFDPVRAKAEGRELAGMDAETAVLFPDSFEETELGMVPRGWKERTLSEFSVLNPEVWTRDTAPDQIEYIDLSNTKRGIIESTIKHQWKDAPSRAQRILRAGDSILGTVRPGNESYALISEEVLTGSTGFAVLRPVKREFRDYVYLAATAPANIERLSNLADGAAYPAVSPEMIMSTQVVKIPDPIIKRFSHLTCPLLDRFAANCKESSTLATLRDVLLPMLISGKIRTNDVEDFLRERCS